MGHRGHGTVRPVAAHDAMKEGRPPARGKSRPSGSARSSRSPTPSSGDELGVVEPVRTRNIEIVVVKSIIVVIVVFLIIVVLMLDHEVVMID